MATKEHWETEQTVRRHLAANEHRQAVDVAFRRYGAEVFGFLLANCPDPHGAKEVFSQFIERLVLGLKTFRGKNRLADRCSLRTWVYTLARNALSNYRRDTRRRERRLRPLPEGSKFSALARTDRTATAPYLRTEQRQRFAALRETLPPADLEMLVLRIDRKFSWRQIARILHRSTSPLTEADVERSAARLRQRFRALRQRLYEQAQQAGVIPCSEGGA